MLTLQRVNSAGRKKVVALWQVGCTHTHTHALRVWRPQQQPHSKEQTCSSYWLLSGHISPRLAKLTCSLSLLTVGSRLQASLFLSSLLPYPPHPPFYPDPCVFKEKESVLAVIVSFQDILLLHLAIFQNRLICAWHFTSSFEDQKEVATKNIGLQKHHKGNLIYSNLYLLTRNFFNAINFFVNLCHYLFLEHPSFYALKI